MLTIINILISLAGGALIFCLIAFVIIAIGNTETKQERKVSNLITVRNIRTQKLISLLNEIGYPDRGGGYSDEKMELWNKYFELEAEDSRLREIERNL